MKISIGVNKGCLRLRWQYQGEPFSLYLGMKDSPTARAAARAKASQIEADIYSGNFDPTLLKYKPRVLGKSATEITAPELFERFTQHKLKNEGVSPRSIETRYKPLLRYLQRSLNLSAHEVTESKARNFKALLMENVTPQTTKARLWLLQSCWNWAKGKYHLAPDNPWQGLIEGIKPRPHQKVKPFTMAEVKAILNGFKSDRCYRYYYPFVVFLLGTACRMGEAIGLRWKHVADDFQTCWIGESISRGHHRSTKTGKARTILLSASVQAVLREHFEAVQPQPGDLVFPAPKGGVINDRMFNRRAWKTILDRVNVPYRKPYSTRHTAISHSLANGANPVQVAEQTGHGPRVLYQSYASVIESKPVFVDFDCLQN